MAILLTNPTTIDSGGYTSDGTGWGMSIWLKFDPEAGGSGNSQMIGAFPGGQNTHIYINPAGYIEMRAHGYTHWIDPELMKSNSGISPQIFIKPDTLYNIIYLTFPAATSGNTDFEIYVNGKLAAYSKDNNASYYPGTPSYREIGNSTGISPVSFGDFAIWSTDIRGIVKEIYNGGSIRDWRLLSIKPSHYWRIGESEGLDQVEDLGSVGGRPFVYTGEPVTFKKKFHPRRKRKPKIKLSGGDTIEVPVGSDYTEPGVFQEGGVLGRKALYDVTVTGTVDTSTEGSYELTYSFVDKYGNTITKTRTVIVAAQDPNRAAVAGDTIISKSDSASLATSISNYGGTWSFSGSTGFPTGETAVIIEVIPPPSSGAPMYKVNYQGNTRYISEDYRFRYNYIELV